MTTILVAGEDRVDAGKTTFSVGLLGRLGSEGREPRAFKPRAGNDYWFDHDDVRTVLGEGRLHGEDARRLVEAAADDHRPEAINPVHRLWRPTPGEMGLLGEPDRTFLVDRITTTDGPLFVVNDEADLPTLVRESLPVDDAVAVDAVPAFNGVMQERYLPAFERVADDIRGADTAVVEAYGDVALPVEGVAFDAVATVAPGRARVWDGERYAEACSAAASSARGQLEQRVDAVLSHLDPLGTVDLPALSTPERQRPAAVADAYGRAYDLVLSVA